MFPSPISSHMVLFMVRYGEIALKSPRVRSYFERTLAQNILSRFSDAGRECRIESERGRIFLWSEDGEFTRGVLSRTFGIVSFSNVVETTAEREDIYETSIALSKPFFKQNIRFCVRVRRNGEHEYTSMELARDTGSAVFIANEHLSPVVDLTHPELEIFIDVRQNRSYIYTGSQKGPGGMPYGTQGRILGIANRSRDIAACWLIMKRGCRVVLMTDNPELAAPLLKWVPDLKIVEKTDDLTNAAARFRVNGICLGWDIEDFDRELAAVHDVKLPMFHPLIGMGKDEVERLSAMIDDGT